MDKELTMDEEQDERDLFCYKASHDLKAPLASIIGLTNLAKEEVKDAKALSYFYMIEQSTQRLNNTLNDLLFFTRISKGEKEISPIDFQLLIQQILDSLKHSPAFKGVDFKIHLEQQYVLYSDKNMLTSILQNLIDNAIKYQRANVASYVSIIVKDAANGAEITISDNGQGIAKELQEKVFKMFFRGSTQSEGSGLGLFIVKTAVKKLNGRIELKSELNQGTTITVYVPDEKPAKS